MNRWQEKLDQHPIHETLEWLRESVSKEFDDIDENEIPEKRRILKIISAYEEVLKELDPELIPLNQLDSLNNALRHQNITSQVNSYISNGNATHLVKLNDLVSLQLTPLSLLKSLLEKNLSTSPIKELEGLVDSISTTLVNKKDSLDNEVASLSDTVKKQQELLQQLSDNIEKKKQEVESHIHEWQQQFSAAQERRSQNFTAWREKFTKEKNEKIKSTIAEYKKILSEFTDEFKQEIDDILSDGHKKHESILELYELTAGDSVGAGYLQNASDEKKQADRWRWISVGFIVCTVVWLLSSYYFNFAAHSKENVANSTQVQSQPVQQVNNKSKSISSPSSHSTNLPWFRLLTTFSISGVLLWGSAYSTQQSTKHRNNEKRTRWFAMEMKAFDPFISSLDEEERKVLKKELCQRVFGKSTEYKEDNPSVIDEHVFKTIADVFIKFLKNAR